MYFLSECEFFSFHFISCSCWSMVLLRMLCCFAHYFYLLSVHSQCNRVRCNVLPSRRSTLWRDSMVFLSTFVSSTLHRIPILFTYVSGFHFISFHFAINKLKRAEKNIFFLFFTHLIWWGKENNLFHIYIYTKCYTQTNAFHCVRTTHTYSHFDLIK